VALPCPAIRTHLSGRYGMAPRIDGAKISP
jgi:hypothetical protein